MFFEQQRSNPCNNAGYIMLVCTQLEAWSLVRIESQIQRRKVLGPSLVADCPRKPPMRCISGSPPFIMSPFETQRMARLLRTTCFVVSNSTGVARDSNGVRNSASTITSLPLDSWSVILCTSLICGVAPNAINSPTIASSISSRVAFPSVGRMISTSPSKVSCLRKGCLIMIVGLVRWSYWIFPLWIGRSTLIKLVWTFVLAQRPYSIL